MLVGPADEGADDATHPLQVPTAAHSVMFALPALHRTGYQVPVLRSECTSSSQTGSGKLLELGAAEASRSPPTWGLCERRACARLRQTTEAVVLSSCAAATADAAL